METELTQLLQIKHPIIQAPIGSATNPILASEVSNAGGLGFLALSWKSFDSCRQLIRRTKTLTDKPFGVNLVLDWDQAEKVKICIEEKVPIVSFFWGDSAPYLPSLKANGIIIGQTVGNLAEAIHYEKLGIDFLFAQGWEAGGHVWGKVTSLVLIQALANKLKTPIVACGGFVDGKGLIAALTLGASGICMGTRFLMSKEALIEQAYTDLIADASENDTFYNENLFNVGWENAPHRVLKNSTVNNWISANKPSVGQRPNEGTVIGKNPNGAAILLYSDTNPILGTTGELEKMALYAGQSAGLITSSMKAKAIVEQVMAEAATTIAQLAQKYAK